MEPLTTEQQSEYIDKCGSTCPACGVVDMTVTVEFDGDTSTQTCGKCGAIFEETWTLTGVERLA